MDLKSGTVEFSLPIKVEWVKVSCLSLEGEHGPKEEHLMERMGEGGGGDLLSYIQFLLLYAPTTGLLLHKTAANHKKRQFICGKEI